MKTHLRIAILIVLGVLSPAYAGDKYDEQMKAIRVEQARLQLIQQRMNLEYQAMQNAINLDRQRQQMYQQNWNNLQANVNGWQNIRWTYDNDRYYQQQQQIAWQHQIAQQQRMQQDEKRAQANRAAQQQRVRQDAQRARQYQARRR